MISDHKERTAPLTGTELAIIEDEDGLRSVAVSNLVNLTRKARRFDEVPPNAYCGTAPYGTADAEPAWTIQRLTISPDGSTVTQSVSGIRWNDRLTATYS